MIRATDAGPPPRRIPMRLFETTGFGGLRLDADPQDLGWDGAINLQNVAFDRQGRVRQRDGVTKANASAMGTGTAVQILRYVSSTGTVALIILRTTGGSLYLDTMSTGGSITNVGNWASTTGFIDAALFGTPTSTLLFIASEGASVATLRKYDGSAIATSVGKPRYVAVTPLDNRLAQANFAAAADSPTGANGSPSTVFFSDEGAPETFSANNYVHLHPGDGDVITGMVSLGNDLFVFKERSMFVMWGTNTDSAGDTEFNFRHYPLPAKIRQQTWAQAVAYNGAVYFLTDRGLCRTDGGPPILVGEQIRPVFLGSVPSEFTIGAIDSSTYATWIHACGGLLWVSVDFTSSAIRSLVYDSTTDTWTLWSIDGSLGVVALPISAGNPDQTYFVMDGVIGKLDPTVTTDLGLSMTSSYRTGYSSLGSTASSEKLIRRLRIDGTGTVAVSAATGAGGSLDTAANVTLGTSPVVARGYHQRSYRGPQLGLNFANVSGGAWMLHRVIADVVGDHGGRLSP